MTRTDLISEDPSVIAAGFKARGMTNQEIEKLLKIHESSLFLLLWNNHQYFQETA